MNNDPNSEKINPLAFSSRASPPSYYVPAPASSGCGSTFRSLITDTANMTSRCRCFRSPVRLSEQRDRQPDEFPGKVCECREEHSWTCLVTCNTAAFIWWCFFVGEQKSREVRPLWEGEDREIRMHPLPLRSVKSCCSRGQMLPAASPSLTSRSPNLALHFTCITRAVMNFSASTRFLCENCDQNDRKSGTREADDDDDDDEEDQLVVSLVCRQSLP